MFCLLTCVCFALHFLSGVRIFGAIYQIGGDRMMFEGAGETMLQLGYEFSFFIRFCFRQEFSGPCYVGRAGQSYSYF